jgi:hypothetical protein
MGRVTFCLAEREWAGQIEEAGVEELHHFDSPAKLPPWSYPRRWLSRYFLLDSFTFFDDLCAHPSRVRWWNTLLSRGG